LGLFLVKCRLNPILAAWSNSNQSATKRDNAAKLCGAKPKSSIGLVGRCTAGHPDLESAYARSDVRPGAPRRRRSQLHEPKARIFPYPLRIACAAMRIASGVAGASNGTWRPGLSEWTASSTAQKTEIASISGGSPTAFER
jgi:hypothetical protein